MNPSSGQRKSRMVFKILRRKSQRGLDFARRTMLEERIESDIIQKALEYYVTHWQILTHPGPFLIAYEAVGGNPDKADEAQGAIVMLAAALDIHDDIIDRSKTKHGTLTVAGKFGNDVALLLGNAFFIGGFALLGRAASRLLANRTEEVLQVAKAAMFETGDAHALEFAFRGKLDADPKEYMKILEMKGAATIMSIKLGAMLGGGSEKEIQALARYGRIFGTLAALREEFIDIFESEELNNRIQNECLPLPVLYALQDKNSTEIRRILSKRELSDGDITKLLDLVLESKQVRKLKNKMKTLAKEACTLLLAIENRGSLNIFTQMVQTLTEDL